MHEFGIAKKLLDAVLAEAREKKAREVKEIWVELGEIADVTEEELRTALREVARGTIAANAAFHFEMKQPRIKCGKGHESLLEKEKDYGESLFLSCPKCGERALVTGGRECGVVRVRAE